MMRPFDVSKVDEDGVTVLRLTGELDASDSATLVKTFGPLKSQDRVVIDLSECDFIDSAGIAAVVEAWRVHDETGEGSVSLAAATGQVERVIRIAGIDAYIPVFEGLEEELARLPADGKAGG